jgi:hypothetical protein
MTNKHLIATIMNTLFDVGKLRLVRGLPRDLALMTEWQPIPGVMA